MSAPVGQHQKPSTITTLAYRDDNARLDWAQLSRRSLAVGNGRAKDRRAEYRLHGLNGLLSEGRSRVYPHGAVLPGPPSPRCRLADGQMEVGLAFRLASCQRLGGFVNSHRLLRRAAAADPPWPRNHARCPCRSQRLLLACRGQHRLMRKATRHPNRYMLAHVGTCRV
jgi:hypothetical protein